MYPGLLDIPFTVAGKFPNRESHKYRKGRDWETRCYRDLAADIKALALALKEYIRKGDHVSFFMNNRYEWIVSDFALMSLSAVSVPRGSDTTVREAAFIYNHSDSQWLIAENAAQVEALAQEFEEQSFEHPKGIFLAEAEGMEALPEAVRSLVVPYEKLLAEGRRMVLDSPGQFDELAGQVNPEDRVSIIYTSGTTGNPKGVMLNHINFLQNVESNTPRMEISEDPGEITVTLLPAWHVFERTFEYCALSAGMTFVYSSLRYFASDLKAYRPQLLISVPRVWESIYQKLLKHIDGFSPAKRFIFNLMVRINYDYGYSLRYLHGSYLYFRRKVFVKWLFFYLLHGLRTFFYFPLHLAAERIFAPIRENVGGRLRGAISGGGALPHYIDSFFNSVGITLLNAYGMTECAPGLLSRRFQCNTIGATGTPFLNTEVKVLREDDGQEAQVGEKGLLYVRGPQVMEGYYKNPEATQEILDEEGWLNTGDLAMQSANGDYVLVGRSKDTIVLAGGENVEPETLEDKLKESPLFDHAVVMGQDKKGLTALVAVNEEELQKIAAKTKTNAEELFSREAGARELLAVEQALEEGAENPMQRILEDEVNRLISKEQGFRPFEKIARVIPVKNDFAVGRELTQTLKVKRRYVAEKYHDLIQWFEEQNFGENIGRRFEQGKKRLKRKKKK